MGFRQFLKQSEIVLLVTVNQA